MGQFISFVICLIRSQSFCNVFCNSQKIFHQDMIYHRAKCPGPRPEIKGAKIKIEKKDKRTERKENRRKKKWNVKRKKKRKKWLRTLSYRDWKCKGDIGLRLFLPFCLISSICGSVHEHMQRRSHWKSTEIFTILGPFWNPQTFVLFLSCHWKRVC